MLLKALSRKMQKVSESFVGWNRTSKQETASIVLVIALVQRKTLGLYRKPQKHNTADSSTTTPAK